MKKTIAGKWLEQMEKPMTIGGYDAGLDRRAVRQMKNDAEDVLKGASPRYTDIYVFRDGSGLWLKRENDWFVMDTEDIPAHRGEPEDEELMENNDR